MDARMVAESGVGTAGTLTRNNGAASIESGAETDVASVEDGDS